MTDTTSRSRVLAAFAAVYIVWGSTYLAIRYGVMTIPPFMMVGARFLVSGTILYAWTRLRGAAKPSSREWRDASLAGTLMLCGGNGAVAWAEQRVPSGLAALIVAIVPLWMVLLEWARPRGTRPTLLTSLGVVLGLVGLAVLVGRDAFTGPNDGVLIGSIVLVLGSLAWAGGSVVSRYGAHPDSSAMATGMQMLGGGVLLLLCSELVGEPSHFSVAHVSTASWLGWVYLVTFGSLLGFTAYIYLLKSVTPAKASTYAYVNPVVAVFLGWAIAHEQITPRMLLGAAVILGAVAMITLSQARAKLSA